MSFIEWLILFVICGFLAVGPHGNLQGFEAVVIGLLCAIVVQGMNIGYNLQEVRDEMKRGKHD